MKFLKRTPREFKVTIADPWTINGKPTEATSPQSVLTEIYDMAVYFPITITVTGPEVSYVLEMDEKMNTRPVDSVSKSGDADEDTAASPAAAGAGEEEHESIESLVEDADTEDEAEEHTAATASAIDDSDDDDEGDEGDDARKYVIPQVLTGKKSLITAGGVLIAMLLGGFLLTQFAGFGGNSDDAQASNTEEESWQTPFPEAQSVDQTLDGDYSNQLWSIEPGEADQISWFAAGVLALDGDEIRLHSHLSGDEVATHTMEDADLDEDLRWVAEFYHQQEPAVGLRISDTFVALTADGEAQEWNVPSEMEIGVYGTTPTMTNASTADDTDEITYQALHIGEEDPVDLTVNPDLATRAVDGDWIVQLDGNLPRVAMNPVDRSNDETAAHTVELTTPTEDASFIRHLDAGHGHSMALWEVDGDLYLGIHPLEGDAAGDASTFVPTPFSEDDVTGWAIARGMDLTIIGPYAISLDTGELAAYSETGDFTRGYGPAAVTNDENDRRLFIVDNAEYTESDRIIGYTGRGTILVRLPDGSVAAYGEDGGTA